MKLQSLFPFMNWLPNVTKGSLRADLLAAITGAVIVLPQGVAYAFIAGMPPEYGLYSAMIVSVLASMFGSSKHMITGPAAAISIVVMSAASGYSTSGAMTPDFISTVITLTFMVGAIQLAMGLARLGNLVNFISHTVVIGFTSGAAILIAASQLKHLFGIPVPDGLSFIAGLEVVLSELGDINPYSLAIGLSTLISAILVKKFLRGWPHLLIGMLVGSVVCFVLDGEQQGIALVGALPGTLPPFGLPDLSLESLSALGSGAFAIALLGLIEAVSIARAIAVRSGQRIQGNQEFIGQGLGNFIGSFFSCFAGSGSFTRSGA
ncbi:MAG: SulP family inorganic anion transporter, partial [Oceanobacter sp.]